MYANEGCYFPLLEFLKSVPDDIARATRMKLIMQAGVGLKGVDIATATNRGIKVARIPGVKTGDSAFHVLKWPFIHLGSLHKQNEMHIAVNHNKLGEPIGDTLIGKTVLIMGFGNLGIELAKRLRPFGVKILATNRIWDSYAPNRFNVKGISSKGFRQENKQVTCYGITIWR